MEKIIKRIKEYDFQKAVMLTKNAILLFKDRFYNGEMIYNMIFKPEENTLINEIEIENFQNKLFSVSYNIYSDNLRVYQYDYLHTIPNISRIFSFQVYKRIGYSKFTSSSEYISLDDNRKKEIQDEIHTEIKKALKDVYTGNFQYSNYDTNLDLPDPDIQASKRYTRNKFRQEIKEAGISMEQAAKIYKKIHKMDHWHLIRDISIMEELPKTIENREKKLHERREEVSRLAIKKNIPSDLIPTICAFAVPGSKLYDYM